MNEGPFRMSSRPDNSPPDKPIEQSAPIVEPKRHHEEPIEKKIERPVVRPVEKPKTMQRNLGSHRLGEDRQLKKPLMIGAAALVVLAIVAFGIWTLVSSLGGSGTGIDSKKYQAVFFTNGQVYFGKLNMFNDNYMKLTDIYYLQTSANSDESKNPQQTTTDQGNPTLIKLGSEIHGPEDEMIIAKDQVLFYENLKTDGKVAQSIEKYKSPN